MRRVYGFVYTCVLSLSLTACGTKQQQDSSRPLLFVLGGQSNLAGNSQTNPGALPSMNVQVSYRSANWSSFSGFQPFAYPNHGPASNIGRAIEVKYPGRQIRILVVAAGGSSMFDWRSNGNLLPNAITETQSALESCEFGGLFWFQGEADASSLPAPSVEQPNQWAALFSDLLNTYKAGVGIANMQVVFAQLATTTNPTGFPNYSTVKAQQQLFHDQTAIPMITTDDLKLYDDVHIDASQFDIESQRWIGELK